MESNSKWQKIARFTAFFIAILAAINLYFAEPLKRMRPVVPEGIFTEAALVDEAGAVYELSQHHGKVVVLHFWATWCPPCVDELPPLLEFSKTLDAKQVAFVPVSTDNSAATVKLFLAQRGFEMPVILDTQMKTLRAAKARGIPSTVLLDREGKIRFIAEGAQDWNKTEITDPIRLLISGQPIPNQNGE